MRRSERAALPVRAALHDAGLYFAFRDVPPEELKDPFMQQTIARLAASETLVHVDWSDIGKAPPGTAPAGAIFHVGRCGSTVLSQALKHHGGVVVYAEPLPLNDLLSTPRAWRRESIIAALRSLGAAFAAHAGKPYVLKFSSWSTLFCDLVVEAFPQMPWVFAVRDPVEVLETIVRNPPPWFQGDSDQARLIAERVDPCHQGMSAEEFGARLYRAFCDAISPLDRGRGLLVEYEMLRDSLPAVAAHFNMSLTDEQRQRMAESTRQYAKSRLSRPTAFEPDAAAKRARATVELQAAVEAIAREPLERLRRSFAR